MLSCWQLLLTKYRYIVATDMTWRMTDIVSAYIMRWLEEVLFSDWKQYEGWCQMAKQPGIDGSNRGLILSLLTDYGLLFHPEQKALLNHNLPALTVGSLRDHICFDAIMIFIEQMIKSDNAVRCCSSCSLKKTPKSSKSGPALANEFIEV